MTFDKIEEIISAYPVCQYGFLKTSQLIFSERVRWVCEHECERYQKSWSCPPSVGTVEECRKRCEAYSHVLVFTTLAEVADTAMLKETLATRCGHEKVTRALCNTFAASGEKFLALSSESCSVCEQCTWPSAPCRCPDRMLPCIESFGILVTESAALCDIDFFYDSTTVTWFGMVFLNLQV